MPKSANAISLLELTKLYFKIGSSAFGGWGTTALLLERALVADRKLITKRQLHSATASGQLLPGAAQVILAAQVAYFVRGPRAVVVAMPAYLLPSAALTILFSFLYFNFLRGSNFSQYTLGLQAAVGGIILGNAYRIGTRHTPHVWSWGLVVASFVANLFLGIPVIVILLIAAILGIAASVRFGSSTK